MNIGRIFFLFIACSGRALGVSIKLDIIAHTNQNIVYGTQVHESVNAFLGIPYAQPPLGSLRFRPPQPLKSLSQNEKTILNAISFGQFATSSITRRSWETAFYQQLLSQKIA
jgi:carboxylesterase type B